MQKQLSILFPLLTLSLTVNAQFSYKYFELTSEAKSFYLTGDFLSAGQTYSKAFLESEDIVMRNHRYTAAASYAKAGLGDSAFVHLNFLANNRQDNSYKFKMDEKFIDLHTDPRWHTFIEQLDSNHTTNNKGLNQELVRVLDTVIYYDQFFRNEIDFVKSKYGENSEEIHILLDEQNKRDSENLVIVSDLLNRNGWMGHNLIGNHTLTVFIVIQHANLEVQEKYLPLLRLARDEDELDPASIAMLEDRINVKKGLPQLYGSQIEIDEKGQNIFSEIFEPEKVNERRSLVGLGPIEDYALMFGIEWENE